MTGFDLDRVRAAFPVLADGVARFDAPGGSLTPRAVADAVATAMTSGMCQRGTTTTAQRLTDATVLDARAAMGDLLATDPAGVVFGRSMTALTMDLARTLAQGWGPGDEVVVTRLDHDADIRPWVIAAERAGATVRWLGFDTDTCDLDDLSTVLSERTRLVAVTGASNLFGTRPDLAAISTAAHEVGALVHVDAVHLAPHALVDRVALGADLISCSPYKFFGPHHGVLAGDPALLETLHPDKLDASTDAVPERFELGTLPYEMLAGTTAAVDFLADLAPGEHDSPGHAGHDRRARLEASLAAVHLHEGELLHLLLDGLAAIDGVTVHGRPARRTPTVLITVAGQEPAAVTERLARADVYAPSGSFYAHEAARHAGLGDAGGVRVGLAPYNSVDDVDRLLAALAG